VLRASKSHRTTCLLSEIIDSDGSIRHWHAPSGKLVSTIKEKDEDLQCLNVSYQSNGEKFVVAGSDNNIRVYDGLKHQKLYSSKNIEENGQIGHTNRIYCAKFHPKLPGIIVSGGWDDTVQIWDIRVPNPVRRIFSPRICGDSIDFNDAGTLMLTGSYRKDDPLQTWDWESGKLMETIPWNHEIVPPLTMVYTSQFSHGTTDSSKPNKYILAGGKFFVNHIQCLIRYFHFLIIN
jgi:COMPASS component SWD3